MDFNKLYWNNITFSYPTRRTGINTYIGPISPFELGIAKSWDKWIFDLPNYSTLIQVDSSNVANLQSLIDAAPSNARILIKAGTYRIGNLRTNGKPIQIVGELDANGNKLVQILGSTQLTGSWTLTSGKYKKTPTSLTNALPASSSSTQAIKNNSGQNGFYYSGLEFQLWKDDIPYNSVPLANLSDYAKNCAYSSGDISLNENPSGATLEWGIYSHFIAGTTSNIANSMTITGTDGLVIANINFKYFTGNRNGAVIGRRGDIKTSNLPYKYWCVSNCKVENCRGDAFYMPHESILRGCISYNNGRGSINGCYINPTIYNAGYDISTAKYGLFMGNRCYQNGWAGNDTGDTVKMVNASFFKILFSEYYDNGKTSVQDDISSYSLWLDDCSYWEISYSSFRGSVDGQVYIEINQHGNFHHNIVVGGYLGGFCIFNAISEYIDYQYNSFYPHSEQVFWLFDDERGNTDNYSPAILRRSANMNFRYNHIYFKETNLATYIKYDKTDKPSIYYQGFTSKNIVISDNTYHNRAPIFRLYLSTGDSDIDLTAFQALVGSDSNSFGWGVNSTVV